ncbi:MAG: HNH nuclease family protein [Deltaproteobacteria bacterium]|nr:HNH nuclease family protein [Deltaproteobacteria bacterium]
MATRSFRPRQRRRPGTAAPGGAGTGKLDALVAEAKAARAARAHGYRERSLALHGWICARCAREFEAESLHLLTVHHKDGNHERNPPDGSNWENLCLYCHEAEHTTHTLGDYLTGRDRGR